MAQAHGKALESSEPNGQERLEFFSLPLEIRSQVTEYVLLPGEIHLRPASTKSPGAKVKLDPEWSQPLHQLASAIGLCM